MNAAISMRSRKGSTAMVAAEAGELKLRAYVISVPALNASDLSFSVEKPGSFLVDFDVPQKNVRFQFMNTARILKKQLNMTYTHVKDENRTILDGTLLLDPTNKISANYVFDSRKLKLRYSYVHRGIATFEPCHDFGKNSWELAVSKTVFDGDVIRASYDTLRKVLDLEWLWKSSFNRDGRFKVCNNLI